jgi:ketosteroid isomerase-like protein
VRYAIALSAFLAFAPAVYPDSAGHTQADVDAINQLLERYRATEDAMDLNGQAQLMAPDRVWVSQFAGGRRTNNAENMRIQLLQKGQRKQLAPNFQQITEDRDVLIRFYGGGSVAVASFYRYINRVFPPETPAEVRRDLTPAKGELMSLVLEKRGKQWVIVHTHVSSM